MPATGTVRSERVTVERRPLRGRRVRWFVALGTAALSLVLVLASSAIAEEVFTSQAAAANATDSTWIPAPAQRAAVCIVDTGNDPNPDTSNVVARLSVDGEPGTDRSPDHHGTLMSMIAAAPYNGFGMVGAAPSIDVVSVRASRDGVTFGGTDLAAGIQQCLTYRNTYNIKVISLSLGGGVVSGLDAGLMALTEDMVKNARRAGVDVVAAAGNHEGAVDWPAAFDPVMAVGAATEDGDRCEFAASGPEVDLWAFGCPVDAALSDGTPVWASGSSESAAFVAGVLTQLRQLTPGWTVDQGERALASSAQAMSAGRQLDVGAAFEAAGLADQLVIGHAMVPKLASSSDASVPKPLAPAGPSVPRDMAAPTSAGEAMNRLVTPRSPTGPLRVRLPRPSVGSVRLRQHVLAMSFKNRPRGMVAQVRIYTRMKHRVFPALSRTMSVLDDRFRTKVSGAVSQVSITYRDPQRIKAPSVVLLLHPAR
ncbi:MAG TPA: S8 family serine peptidase [Baekduia sp.]|nr:S8 family serine peptidase [Baekduia sp.]